METGIQLGYLGFAVSNVEAWSDLLQNIIGLKASGINGDESFGFTLDEYEQRVFLRAGKADDVETVGFLAKDNSIVERVIERARSSGVVFQQADPATCEARRVAALWQALDPFGLRVELAVGLARSRDNFRSEVMRGGFVAGDLGLGHIVLYVPDLEQAIQFYGRIFGAEVSDRAMEQYGDFSIDVAFLRLNERHHSIAFGSGIPFPKKAIHFQFEVRTVDEVGSTLDRALKGGVEISKFLGRHPDNALSFYGRTPSGIEWEIGAEELRTDSSWTPRSLHAFSLWGHGSRS